MPIKESSDELNPAVVVADSIPKPRTKRSVKDYLALAIATCGVGYLPLAPGTWGSLVGVAVYVAIHLAVWRLVDPTLTFDSLARFQVLPVMIAVQLVVIGAVVLVGIWAASRTEALTGKKDPGKVVIDEVAGQLIALLPLVAGISSGWVSVLVGFALFRFFDIVKPYPARQLEGLPAGLGIMSDDIVAGAYAAIVTGIVIAFIFSP